MSMFTSLKLPKSVMGEEVKCPVCGKKFYKKVKHQKYCSWVCSEKTKSYEWLLENEASNKRLAWLKVRFEVLKRDNFTCQYCGRSPKKHGVALEIDHVIPKSKGGTHKISNLITACEDCNRGKKDVLIEENELRKLSK